MYLYGQSGSGHAVNAATQKLFSNIDELAKAMIEDYSEACKKIHHGASFMKWVNSLSGFRVYIIEPDSNKSCKKVFGKTLIKLLMNSEVTKPIIAKELLKN